MPITEITFGYSVNTNTFFRNVKCWAGVSEVRDKTWKG